MARLERLDPMPVAGPALAPGPRWVVLTLLALALGFAQLALPLRAVDGLIDATGHVIGRDFINVWTAGRLVLDGRLDVLPDIAAYQAAQRELFGHPIAPHNWSYPPLFLPATVAFGALPYPVALALWSAGGLALMLWAGARAGLEHRWLALLAIAPATCVNLWNGQNGFLSAALLLGGLAALDRRPSLAGVLFGLLAYKPHLALLLPVALLAAGAWRAIAAAAFTGALLVAGSVLLFGVEPWRDWLGEIAPFQRQLLQEGRGLFTLMMPTAFMAGRTLGLPLAACWAMAALVAVAAIAAVWRVFRTGAAAHGHPAGRQLGHAVLLIACALASPYAHSYDLTLVAIAVMLAARHQDCLAAASAWLLAAWVLPVLLVPLNALGLPLGPVVLAGAMLSLTRAHQAYLQRGAQL